MYLAEYTTGDILLVESEPEQDLVQWYESDPNIHLRTFKSESGEPAAVGMCSQEGEIGLIVKHSDISSPKEFYTLVVLFCAEAFAFSKKAALVTGFDQHSARDMRWCKFLGMSIATDQIEEHTSRGWVTYEFPLSNWVR